MVLAPVYLLRLFQGAMHGEATDKRPLADIYVGQLTILAPLIVLMFVLGLDPFVLTRLMTSLGQVGLAQ